MKTNLYLIYFIEVTLHENHLPIHSAMPFALVGKFRIYLFTFVKVDYIALLLKKLPVRDQGTHCSQFLWLQYACLSSIILILFFISLRFLLMNEMEIVRLPAKCLLFFWKKGYVGNKHLNLCYTCLCFLFKQIISHLRSVL